LDNLEKRLSVLLELDKNEELLSFAFENLYQSESDDILMYPL